MSDGGLEERRQRFIQKRQRYVVIRRVVAFALVLILVLAAVGRIDSLLGVVVALGGVVVAIALSMILEDATYQIRFCEERLEEHRSMREAIRTVRIEVSTTGGPHEPG